MITIKPSKRDSDSVTWKGKRNMIDEKAENTTRAMSPTDKGFPFGSNRKRRKMIMKS